jgi:hypothetical protein
VTQGSSGFFVAKGAPQNDDQNKSIPQGLKPILLASFYATAKAVALTKATARRNKRKRRSKSKDKFGGLSTPLHCILLRSR